MTAGIVQLKWLRLSQARRKLHKQIRTAFRAQREVYLKNLRVFRNEFREDFKADAFDRTKQETQQTFDAAIQQAALTSAGYGFDATIKQIGIEGYSFDLTNPEAERYYQDYGLQRTALIFGKTEAELAKIITQAIAEGWSYDRTAQAISEKFTEFTHRRSELIAVTEVGNAYEEAGRFVIRDLQSSGLRFKKKQITAADERVCEKCRSNADMGWIDATESFNFAPPMTHPGCRCATGYEMVT